MSEDGIPVFYENLPTTIHGFTTLGVDYEPIIIINARLPVELQRKAYQHELHHITSGEIWDEEFVEYGN